MIGQKGAVRFLLSAVVAAGTSALLPACGEAVRTGGPNGKR